MKTASGHGAPFLLHMAIDRTSQPSPAEYPWCLPVVRHLRTMSFHPGVTYIIGENGSGKSTLLEALAIAMGLNAEGGSRNARFQTEATHSALHQHLRVAKGVRRPRTSYFLRAESYYNVASYLNALDGEFSFGPPTKESYGGTGLHAMSHGESFLALLMHRFGPDGLYILDEPEAALSPTSQMAMLTRMHDLVRAGSQFVIATHSPLVLAYPDADIWQVSERGLKKVQYEETSHVCITRRFLDKRDEVLRELLGDESLGT